MFQREATSDAVTVHKGPNSTAITFSNTPDGRRAMSRHLAMLGTTGVAIRRAEAGVRGALQRHRRTQETHRRGWAGIGVPSLSSSRQSVRDAVQQLRWQRSRLERDFGDDALVMVLDADGCSLDAYPDPVLLSHFQKASDRPFDWRFEFHTRRSMDQGVVEGLGAYNGPDFRLVRLPVDRHGIQRGFA